ncbi:MAG TPA: hypothetical protein PLI95_00785 [Polyangiaceae bacterium]|nr:hypothetical protein [Polyangiaceae bacterium]
MRRRSSLHSLVLLGLVPLITASCGGDGESNPGAAGTGGAGASADGPPEPATEHPPCVLSADCPAGQHCDLGECIQDCNTNLPCAEGATCSPRARCLEPSAKDTDPPPVSAKGGELTLESSSFHVTDADDRVKVVLKATSNTPVRYRVQINAPHLRLAEPRGVFTGSTTLEFLVDRSTLAGPTAAGSVKVFSTLGNAVFDTSIRVGRSGAYAGAMRYDSGPVSLGQTRLALELIEEKGDVSARVDASRSLLFPETASGATTGIGTYSETAGMVLSLAQRIDASFAGERNHLGRDIGRKLTLNLKPGPRGSLSGTFEETIHGLFVQPIKLGGTVALELRGSGEAPQFKVGTPAEMPAAPSPKDYLSPSPVFDFNVLSCGNLVCGTPTGQCANLPQSLSAVEAQYYDPLAQSMLKKAGVDAFVNLATACDHAMSLKSLADYGASNKQCGLVVPLACGLALASAQPTADTANGKTFGRLLKETLDAPLLVAKNDMVEAVGESIVQGNDAELSRYDHALEILAPVSRWVMQPAIIEFMRSMTPEAAKGDPPADNATQNASYPSARALLELVRTKALLDAERSRVSTSGNWSDPTSMARDAQQRAVMAFLESAVIAQVLEAWNGAPASVTVGLTGVLQPLDQAHAAMSQGANAFGVPGGYVPFVYRDSAVSKGATNFEQMASIAGESLTHYAKAETAFKESDRAFELNEQQLRAELQNTRTQYDTQIKTICGSAFDPDAVTGPESWAACGAQGAGQVGELVLEIERANASLHSAEGRIQGMKDKIAIDQNALVQSQQVHAETLQFLDRNGQALAALAIADATIRAEQKLVEVSAQSNIANFGAPIAMAAFDAVLEMMRGAIEAEKQRLQTAQSMRFEQASAQLDLINGMANIQKQTIDLVQLGIDIEQDSVAVLLAKLRARNAVEQAKMLWDTRQQSLDVITSQLNPTNDPAFRIVRDKLAVELLASRRTAQRQLFLAGRALEYEINQSLAAMGPAVLSASNEMRLSSLSSCLDLIHSNYLMAYGTPQEYSTTVSVRKMLGITGVRKDEVTDEELTEGAQFRQLLLRNENLDGKGGVGIAFPTNLQPDNGLWSSNVCLDRVVSVQAQIVGDFLGDNDARVQLVLDGGGVVRSCGEEKVETWSFGAESAPSSAAIANIQAGVNTYGEAPANKSLFGCPVAAATWSVLVPGGSTEPANKDLDLTKIEDIVLKINHAAIPQKTSAITVDTSCLGGV